jgi:hypothetical protein
MAGDELPADPKKLPTELGGKKLTGKVSSATINGDDLGSKLAAVGVIAVDLAGNASPVSNIACVKVVPTTGFWDKYKANGGKAESGCACSLPGAPIDVAAGWPVGLVLGGLALRGVRARRRRS